MFDLNPKSEKCPVDFIIEYSRLVNWELTLHFCFCISKKDNILEFSGRHTYFLKITFVSKAKYKLY